MPKGDFGRVSTSVPKGWRFSFCASPPLESGVLVIFLARIPALATLFRQNGGYATSLKNQRNGERDCRLSFKRPTPPFIMSARRGLTLASSKSFWIWMGSAGATGLLLAERKTAVQTRSTTCGSMAAAALLLCSAPTGSSGAATGQLCFSSMRKFELWSPGCTKGERPCDECGCWEPEDGVSGKTPLLVEHERGDTETNLGKAMGASFPVPSAETRGLAKP